MHSNVFPYMRAIACAAVLHALAPLGCSFDTSAHSPDRAGRPVRGMDMDGRGLRDASTEPPGGGDGDARPPQRLDAGRDSAVPPEPPPANKPDAAIDAGGMDAAPKDAGKDEPDAASDAGDEGEDAGGEDPGECEEPPDCVCPHEAVGGDGPCAPATCPLDECAPDDDCRYLEFQSHSYYFCDDERTWEQARERCADVDGFRLVTVDGADEDAFILANVGDKTWLGGDDRGEGREGQWAWTDGTPFYEGDQEGEAVDGAYVNWHSSEPNNIGLGATASDCLLLWYENAAWADASCGDRHGYVCELDP